jgi:acetyltransferase-like isoleucine patch superfamily enzyme/coenzyme F420-reducing hydrogenase beta subunit
MINIFRKENCTGCGACVDICPTKAIVLETDIEGFWYPKVNHELCTNCGLCEKVCAELHIEELKDSCITKEPIVFSAIHKENDVRRESTSGGLFSALASKVYEEGGYVGGAVYTDDFQVKHILSNDRNDLLKIRGSKHCQSDMGGIFLKTKELLDNEELVLICATPCQIAALRRFLGKDYEQLVLIDFICLGINSNKIFGKYLESLEQKFGSKVVSVQAKNKDKGWRSLAYKIRFENQKVYLREGKSDDFTRGFISAHINSRPTCYECKYKGFPRISDITLGDFWGIENFDKTMDDNMGTSVVLINSKKGTSFFDSIKDLINTKEMPLATVIPGNQALLHSVMKSSINRNEFYKDLKELSFDAVVRKHYPLEKKTVKNIKKIVRYTRRRLILMGYSPLVYMKFIWINFMRKNTKCKANKAKLIFPSSYTIMDIHKQALISIRGSMDLGHKRIRGSRLETRLAVEENGSLSIESGHISVYYGTDILVFKGASLTLKGSITLNQRVQIICMDSITIGSDVLISRDVVIRDNDGGHEILKEGYKKNAPVVIGNHVWIGQGAIIMKGVTIGDGAIIAAGAWVVSNVKPNSLVMADPARQVQKNVEWRA